MTRVPRYRLALGLILVLAVMLRVVNYTALAESPCLIHHHMSDMAFFEEWSTKIGNGDVLTREATHPLHAWHRIVAAMHFERHPDEIGGLDITKIPEAEQTEHYRALWNRWYGGETFHQEPLYPYALALIRSIAGPDRMWVHFAQMLLGICTLLLLHSVTRSYFGEPAAVVATGLATLCSPLLFFELFLLRAAPIVFATVALVFVFERMIRSRSTRHWFLFGICTGIATALKSHFLVFGCIAMAMAVWPQRKRVTTCVRSIGWFAGGGFLAFVPILARNLIVGAPALSLTSVGPVTFANANDSAYIGFGWSESDASLSLLERIMTESGGSFFGAISSAIGSHDGFGSYLALLWTKFALAWQWAEFPNNVNLYFAEMHSNVLAFLPVTFTVVACAALAGLIASIRRHQVPKPLLVFIALSTLQLVAFYSLARFRAALMVAMLPLAGHGIAWLVREIRSKQYRIAIPTLVACALFAWCLERPIPPNMVLLGNAPYGNALNNYYRPRWAQVEQAKDWGRGRRLMKRALDARPTYLDTLTRQNLPTTHSRWRMTGIYAELYFNYAHSLHELGRQAESKAMRTRAEDLANIFRTIDRRRRQPK